MNYINFKYVWNFKDYFMISDEIKVISREEISLAIVVDVREKEIEIQNYGETHNKIITLSDLEELYIVMDDIMYVA